MVPIAVLFHFNRNTLDSTVALRFLTMLTNQSGISRVNPRAFLVQFNKMNILKIRLHHNVSLGTRAYKSLKGQRVKKNLLL